MSSRSPFLSAVKALNAKCAGMGAIRNRQACSGRHSNEERNHYGDRVKWGNLEHMGNLERPCKSSIKGKLQVKFLVYNVSVN